MRQYLHTTESCQSCLHALWKSIRIDVLQSSSTLIDASTQAPTALGFRLGIWIALSDFNHLSLLQFAKLRCNPWFEQAPSHQNLSDPLSPGMGWPACGCSHPIWGLEASRAFSPMGCLGTYFKIHILLHRSLGLKNMQRWESSLSEALLSNNSSPCRLKAPDLQLAIVILASPVV